MQMNLEYFPVDNQVFVDISSFVSPDDMLINVPHNNILGNQLSFRSPWLQTPSSCMQLMNTL